MLKTIANFAKGIRTFLGFAALIVIVFVGVFSYMFSQGAFDPVLANFNRLDKDQFFGLVVTVLLLTFVVLILLIVLSFVVTKQPSDSDTSGEANLSVIVHSEGDETLGIEGAIVTLSLSPEPVEKLTDSRGNVIFFFSKHLAGRSFLINARKSNYQQRKPKKVRLQNGRQVYFPLKQLGKARQVAGNKVASMDDDLDYLTRPAILLRAFGIRGVSNACIKNLRLGDKYECDFIILTEHSFLQDICIIEVESPEARPFTDAGEYSPELNRAINHIHNCLAWIEQHNIDFLESLKATLIHDYGIKSPHLRGAEHLSINAKIIIGRRYMFSDEDDSRRAMVYKQSSIEITNYDRLLEADQKL